MASSKQPKGASSRQGSHQQLVPDRKAFVEEAKGITSSSEDSDTRTVLIVGAGISGLLCAIHLSRLRNFRVTIIEKQDETSMHARESVGNLSTFDPVILSDEVCSIALRRLKIQWEKVPGSGNYRPKAMIVRSWGGKMLQYLPCHKRVMEYMTMWSMLLEEAAACGVIVRWEQVIADWVDVGWGVVSLLESGERIAADLLVAADGRDGPVSRWVCSAGKISPRQEHEMPDADPTTEGGGQAQASQHPVATSSTNDGVGQVWSIGSWSGCSEDTTGQAFTKFEGCPQLFLGVSTCLEMQVFGQEYRWCLRIGGGQYQTVLDMKMTWEGVQRRLRTFPEVWKPLTRLIMSCSQPCFNEAKYHPPAETLGVGRVVCIGTGLRPGSLGGPFPNWFEDLFKQCQSLCDSMQPYRIPAELQKAVSEYNRNNLDDVEQSCALEEFNARKWVISGIDMDMARVGDGNGNMENSPVPAVDGLEQENFPILLSAT